MVRVKRGKIARKKRKRLLKKVKGFKWGRKKRYALAKQALTKALIHAYVDRKRKKREFRKLWQTQISAACKRFDLSYSKFIHGLKQKRVELNRKILAEIAQKYPEIFEKIVSMVKS